jgi:hypothetical protein
MQQDAGGKETDNSPSSHKSAISPHLIPRTTVSRGVDFEDGPFNLLQAGSRRGCVPAGFPPR